MLKLFVSVEGCARGNPGEGAIGVLLTDERANVVEELSECVGRTTQGMAEYKALIQGARRAIAYAPEEVVFLTDDQMVANQLNGLCQAREPHLQHLAQVALGLLAQIPKWRVNYIERDGNRAAQRLAEEAFREHAREERERSILCQQVEGLLRELSTDELRKVLTYIRSLLPAGTQR
ncbi:MAG: ribonuclease HI family protein [Candidatus Bipolaricaulota bacterium]